MLLTLTQPEPIVVVPRDFSWGDDLTAISAIVSSRFSDFNGNGFYPHPDEVRLQRELQAVPSLAKLSRVINCPARAMAITGLGLAALDEPQRNAVLYAIALCLGFPTSTDQRTRRVAWDIRARPGTEQQLRYVTFSERIGSADMHTDSSFYPMPEEQFLLYVVKAARCNGGQSLLVDVDDIYHALQASEQGRAAYALLSDTPLPFRVPAVYAANDDQIEYHLAPVFHHPRELDGGLAMRWRYDSIIKGLTARPDLDSVPLRAALELVNDLVERHAPRFQRLLLDDTLLWSDNRRTLHGRTWYDDTERHLIRIRISSMPNAERIGPSGIVAD